MRFGLKWLVIFCLAILPGAHAAQQVLLYELETGQQVDLTAALQTLTGLSGFESIASVNASQPDGDDLLILNAAGEVALVDLATFSSLGVFDESVIRDLFSLSDGTGLFAALAQTNTGLDSILYRPDETQDTYAMDLATGAAQRYSGPSLPGGFVTGFSYTAPADIGLLHRNANGIWYYEPFGSGSPVLLNLAPLFGTIPAGITELEINTGAGMLRYLVLLLPDAAFTPTPAPTSTPTPEPTPTPVTSNFKAYIANGLGGDIWRVTSGDYTVTPDVALTGEAPNQIKHHNGQLYVVNSRSNSVSVYSRSCSYERGIAIGDGANPFLLEFWNDNIFYITNFTANTVSQVDAVSGQVLSVLPMPDESELPGDSGVGFHRARPSGIAIASNTCFVACANLNDQFTAAGPGVICTIDTQTNQVSGWFESGGRNTVSVEWNPRWPDRLWIANAGDYITGTGYQSNGSICVWSISQHQMERVIPVNDAPFEMAFGPDTLYFASAQSGTVGRIDLGDLNVKPPVIIPGSVAQMSFISGLAMSPDGNLWVLEFNGEMLYVLDPGQDDQIIRSVEMGSGPDALDFVLD